MGRWSPLPHGGSLLVGLLCLAACQPQLGVPDGATFACEKDTDCPGDQKCHPVTFECVVPGIVVQVPRPTLTFIQPEDEEAEVGLVPTLVVSFSLGVVPESLDLRITLVDTADETPVQLERLDDPPGTTYRYRPTAVLTGAHRYQVAIAAGLEPIDATAAPSDESYQSAFTTRAGDLVAPGPVNGLVVERAGDDRVVLTWTPPADPDYVGALILRRAGGVIEATPESGSVYLAGAALGNASVLTTTQGDRWDDVTVDAMPHDYLVVSVDASGNYGPARRAPFFEAATLTWCTDETASAVIDSPNATTAQVFVSATGETDVTTGDWHPAAGVTPGTPAPIPTGTAVVVGETHTWRPILVGPEGTWVGQPRTFWAASAQLDPTSQPGDVGVPGASWFEYETWNWTSFEAEVDQSPVASLEDWQPTTPVGPGRLEAEVSAAGEYRFRVRPTVAGCAAAAWTVSDTFKAGDFLYVTPSGAGDASGRDPNNALGSIGAALTAATAGTTVFVATGTYNESLVMTPGVALLGGYSADFTWRTLAPPASVVSVALPDPALTADGTFGPDTVISGFRFEVTGTGTGLASTITFATSASLVFEDNEVIGPVTSGTEAVGIWIQGNTTDALVQRCRVKGGDGPAAAVGVSIRNDGHARLVDNVLIGGKGGGTSSGVAIAYGATARLEGNEIIGISDGGNAKAVNLIDAGLVELVNNVIEAGGGQWNSTTIFSTGITSMVVATHNTLRTTGTGADVVTASNLGSLFLRNNLLVTDAGPDNPWCIRDINPGGTILAENNAMVGCPQAMYVAGDTTPYYDTLCAGGQLGVAGCATLLPNTSGNVALATEADVGFVSDTDLHLLASAPDSLKKGGLLASGTSGCTCGDVDTDRDGRLRTCSDPATHCTSMGAYEQDD